MRHSQLQQLALHPAHAAVHMLAPSFGGPHSSRGEGITVATGRGGESQRSCLPDVHREEEEMEEGLNPGLLSLALDYFCCIYAKKKERRWGW